MNKTIVFYIIIITIAKMKKDKKRKINNKIKSL